MGVDYWENYSPVVNCISVRSLLAIESIHKLPIISIDFVLAFPKSYLDVYVFMELPVVIVVDGNRVEWVLKLNKELYGLKQASTHWFSLLKTGIERRGFHQSQIYPCVFYIKYSFILTYVDDRVIVFPKQ